MVFFKRSLKIPTINKNVVVCEIASTTGLEQKDVARRNVSSSGINITTKTTNNEKGAGSKIVSATITWTTNKSRSATSRKRPPNVSATEICPPRRSPNEMQRGGLERLEQGHCAMPEKPTKHCRKAGMKVASILVLPILVLAIAHARQASVPTVNLSKMLRFMSLVLLSARSVAVKFWKNLAAENPTPVR